MANSPAFGESLITYQLFNEQICTAEHGKHQREQYKVCPNQSSVSSGHDQKQAANNEHGIPQKKPVREYLLLTSAAAINVIPAP
jgi:hypothetical protein